MKVMKGFIVLAASVLFLSFTAKAQRKPSESVSKDQFDQSLIDSLKVDIHVMYDQNASTFKQFLDVKPEKALDYTDQNGKDNIHVRTFTFYIHPSTYKPEKHPEMLFMTLKYFDKKDQQIIKETYRVKPHSQAPKIWSGKTLGKQIPIRNARYAVLSVRVKFPGERHLKDLKYRIDLQK